MQVTEGTKRSCTNACGCKRCLNGRHVLEGGAAVAAAAGGEAEAGLNEDTVADLGEGRGRGIRQMLNRAKSWARHLRTWKCAVEWGSEERTEESASSLGSRSVPLIN